MASRGKSARKKGHTYERKIVKELKDMGYNAQTSRYASRQSDDQLIDIIGTDPFNIQCKAVEKTINFLQILEQMPDNSNYNIVFHKKNRQPEIISMYKRDFYKFLKNINYEK